LARRSDPPRKSLKLKLIKGSRGDQIPGHYFGRIILDTKSHPKRYIVDQDDSIFLVHPGPRDGVPDAQSCKLRAHARTVANPADVDCLAMLTQRTSGSFICTGVTTRAAAGPTNRNLNSIA